MAERNFFSHTVGTTVFPKTGKQGWNGLDSHFLWFCQLPPSICNRLGLVQVVNMPLFFPQLGLVQTLIVEQECQLGPGGENQGADYEKG